jgi:hypothetical protein
VIVPQLDRLKAQLLTSGLQQRNQALYQVINQLIDTMRQGLDNVESQINNIVNITTPPSGGTIVVNGGFLARDGEDGIDGFDGMPGLRGLNGIAGPMGPPGMDCECCDDWSMPFVGNSLIEPTGAPPLDKGIYRQVIA